MKFFKSTFIQVTSGSAAILFVMTALASIPMQPRALIDQHGMCVGVFVVEDGVGVKKDTCPEDWKQYKREYVRTVYDY